MWNRPVDKASVQVSVKTNVDIVPSVTGSQLVFYGASVNNRAGSTNNVGICFKYDNCMWKAGQWDNAPTATYTDDTTDAQDAGTNDFALTTTTNDDGFVVQCMKKFGLIGITVTTAAAGGTPVYAATYWNGAWTALTTIEVPTFAATGEKAIFFVPPSDWITNSGTAVTAGLSENYYSVKFAATTAPSSTAALASLLWVAEFYDYKESLADDGIMNFVVEDSRKGIELLGGQSIIPYFYTANANNHVTVRYGLKG